MGIDYTTTYVGPYVECKIEKVDKPRTFRSCTNAKCSNYGGERFSVSTKHCEQCGTKIDNITITSKANKVNSHNVSQEIQEVLTQPLGDSFYYWSQKTGIDLWIANRHRLNKDLRSFSFDPQEEDVQYAEITIELMTTEISEFIDQYRDAISVLRKQYGLENVTIKWGLIMA